MDNIFGRDLNSFETNSDINNAGNGDIKDYNGKQVRVQVNQNGTRRLTPLSSDEIATRQADKIRQYNINANQPAIQQLQKTSTDLDTRYKDLLGSIKGQQKVAEDAQILSTNNEMGRRGISADSGIAEREQAAGLRPIASEYSALTANTGLSQQRDISEIAKQIAMLQTGNPMESLNFSSQLMDREQQASQFERTLAQQIAQANKPQQAQQPERYTTLGEGQTLYDLLNGGAVYTAPKSYAPKSGGVTDSGW